MKNTKMKYKILILMVLLIISINSVNAEVYEGELLSYTYDETDVSIPVTSSNVFIMDALYIEDGAQAADLHSVHVYLDDLYWSGSSTVAYSKSDTVYKLSGDEVGTGYCYFWQQDTDDDGNFDIIYIKHYFNNGLDIPSGNQVIQVEGDIIGEIIFNKYTTATKTITTYDDKMVGIGRFAATTTVNLMPGIHTSKIAKSFYNSYNYWYDENELLFNFNITRNTDNKCELLIENDNTELLNETGLKSTNISIYSDDIDNSTWFLYATDDNNIQHSHTLNFIPDVEALTPTLSTDKLLYNTSEQITISFTNIDEIEGYISERLSLYILYPVVDDYKDYDAKYMLHLYRDRRDETFTLNTSFLTPQNEYHLAVCIDGDFHQIDDALIISDTFFVYDDNEYINTNCNPDANCYTYNGGDISIYYKINNNSNIIIKDNEGNTIQTYYNIIGENELNYNIPEDLNKLNSYPNWKIYLNNTEYETNYSTDVTIYWSLIAIPTPTPIYTSVPTDENVREQIEELKEESKPIFDLIYGLSELVIDNPDYDDDNIITENEMNNWFNSLIPIVLILLIFIVYTGLTKKR